MKGWRIFRHFGPFFFIIESVPSGNYITGILIQNKNDSLFSNKYTAHITINLLDVRSYWGFVWGEKPEPKSATFEVNQL